MAVSSGPIGGTPGLPGTWTVTATPEPLPLSLTAAEIAVLWGRGISLSSADLDQLVRIGRQSRVALTEAHELHLRLRIRFERNHVSLIGLGE